MMEMVPGNRHYYTAFPYNPRNVHARALADTLLLEQGIVAHVLRRAELEHKLLRAACTHADHRHVPAQLGAYTVRRAAIAHDACRRCATRR